MITATARCSRCRALLHAGNQTCSACGETAYVRAGWIQGAGFSLLLGQALLLVAGIVLVFLGLRWPFLGVAGAAASAAIADVQRVRPPAGATTDEYRIFYRFTVNGEHATTGVFTLHQKRGAAGLPRTGSLVAVRYLPGAPSINALTTECEPSLLSLVWLSTGGLALAGWIRLRRQH